MKFSTLLALTTPFLTLTTSTRLCDRLITVKSNMTTLALSTSSLTNRTQLTTAITSLQAATSTLTTLNSEINSTTIAITNASSTLATLDVNTACWLGWLTDLENGLTIVQGNLGDIYRQGAKDMKEGNVGNVQGYGTQISGMARNALDTLNLYVVRDVACWAAGS